MVARTVYVFWRRHQVRHVEILRVVARIEPVQHFHFRAAVWRFETHTVGARQFDKLLFLATF